MARGRQVSGEDLSNSYSDETEEFEKVSFLLWRWWTLKYCLLGLTAQFGDDVAIGKDELSFCDIFELTNVARPVIPDAGFQQILRECFNRAGVFLSILLEKVSAQQQDVAAPLTERRNT